MRRLCARGEPQRPARPSQSTATCATARRSIAPPMAWTPICHAAALVSIWRARREDFDEVNVGGLENVIDVCRARGLARLVYTSSFLALPPAGRPARGAGQRLSAHQGRGARARARGRGTRRPDRLDGARRHLRTGRRDRRQPGRAAGARPSRRTAAGHRRRRPDLVVRLRRGRGGGARRGADEW